MAWSKKYRYANGSENRGPSGAQRGSVQPGANPAQRPYAEPALVGSFNHRVHQGNEPDDRDGRSADVEPGSIAVGGFWDVTKGPANAATARTTLSPNTDRHDQNSRSTPDVSSRARHWTRDTGPHTDRPCPFR